MKRDVENRKSRVESIKRRKLLRMSVATLAVPVLMHVPGWVAATVNAPRVANTVANYRGKAFGSTWLLALDTTSSPMRAIRHIESVVDEVNRVFSPYLPHSEVSAFNQSSHAGEFTFSPTSAMVLATALDQAERTGGIFDPTVGPSVNRWGFGPIGGTLHCTYRDINLVKQSGSVEVSKLDPHVTLDCCGLAKGYALETIANRLVEDHYTDFYLELGGEVLAAGNHPSSREWRTAIEIPAVDGVSVGKSQQPFDRMGQLVIAMDQRSIATSGTYRQGFNLANQHYHHIIDPRTRAPARSELVSVSVLHESATWADCWSTTLSACSYQRALKLIERHQLSVVLQKLDKDQLTIEWFGSVPFLNT